jgi:hypothetical protein
VSAAISVHPFVTGRPHRIGALDAALQYICSRSEVRLWPPAPASIKLASTAKPSNTAAVRYGADADNAT